MAKATCDHCCCCIKLRIGCLIYGYLELLSFIYLIIQLFRLWNGVEPLIELMKELSKTKISDEELEDLRKVLRAVFVGIIVVLVLLSALKIFFNIILLIGLHKNKRAYVGAYLIYTAIFFLFGIIFLIVSITKFANMDNTKIEMPVELEAMIITQFIQIALCYVVGVYFWMVIRSQYHLMPINHPRIFRNPMDAEASTPANLYAQSHGTRSQPSDGLGTNNATRSRHSASLDENTPITNIADSSNQGTASADVSPTLPILAVLPEQNQTEGEVPTSQNIPDQNLTQEEVPTVQNIPKQNLTQEDVPASENIPEENRTQEEVPTSQTNNEGSQAENMTDKTRQSTPPFDVGPSTSSISHVFAALRKSDGELCEIELVPISKKKCFL